MIWFTFVGYSKKKKPGESRLAGVAYTGKFRLPDVAYTGKFRLPDVAYTGDSRLIVVAYTGEVSLWLNNTAKIRQNLKILIEYIL